MQFLELLVCFQNQTKHELWDIPRVFFFGGGLTSRRISEVNDISKSYELIHDLSDYVSLSKKLTPKLPP